MPEMSYGTTLYYFIVFVITSSLLTRKFRPSLP